MSLALACFYGYVTLNCMTKLIYRRRPGRHDSQSERHLKITSLLTQKLAERYDDHLPRCL